MAMMTGGPKIPVHAETVSLVQQQLQTLDSHQLVWQGQVWAGQTMEWRVEERAAREGGGGDAEMPRWQTSLRLQLPSLGNVNAILAFMPQGLRVNLKAEAGTAEIMKSALDKLHRSMELSGLHVLGMSVDRHEKT
ncbi:MAG: flagellar hook-length control protein FliK [Betaproteobacteria bacterium]